VICLGYRRVLGVVEGVRWGRKNAAGVGSRGSVLPVQCTSYISRHLKYKHVGPGTELLEITIPVPVFLHLLMGPLGPVSARAFFFSRATPPYSR